MPKHTGNEGTLKLGAATLGEFREWEISVEPMTVDQTVAGDTWDDIQLLGRSKWSGSATVLFDETDAGQVAAMDAAALLTGYFYFEGETAGDTYFTGSLAITNYSVKASYTDNMELSITFTGSGALTRTTV